MLFMICCLILTLPLVNSGNVTSSKEMNSSPIAASTDVLNKTKLSLPSEGGTLLATTPDLSLPKVNLTSLLTLEEESGKPKLKPIVARKGVDDYTENHIVLKTTAELQNSSVPLESGNPKNMSHSLKNNLTFKNISDVDSISINKTMTTSVPQNITLPKKPLVLSYEALVNADKNIQNDEIKIPATMQSKSKTQILPPNEGTIVKVYPSKANSHPGMIMPIVITILVVPMFAIVGYMALKRGQEAWKNRHYKRMDFLLDGMYND